jgi:Protein of unknown function (DUF1376)
MSEYPEPLTPPECDLRGLPFMPLDVQRLLDSDLFALSTGDEFKAAVALWCKSWLQKPSGSLPNDDRVLAHLSGAYGAWQEVRQNALRGWILCSDGRLYHPVVCEKARIAWSQRVKQRINGAKGGRPRQSEPQPKPPGTRRQASEINADKPNGKAKRNPPPNPSETHPLNDTEPNRKQERGRGIGESLPKESSSKHLESKVPREDAALPSRVVKFRPKVGDPPDEWFGLTGKQETDPDDGVEHAVAGGSYLDVAAGLVCEAAKINPVSWAGDWRPLIRWLEAGADLHDLILPVVRKRAERPNYQPPASLEWYSKEIMGLVDEQPQRVAL